MMDMATWLQAQCLMHYMKGFNTDNVKASKFFEEHNVFAFIRKNYEYLQSINIDDIVRNIVDSLEGKPNAEWAIE